MLKIQINDKGRIEEFLDEVEETVSFNHKENVSGISLYIEFEAEKILFFVSYTNSSVKLEFLIGFEVVWNFLINLGPMDLELNCTDNTEIRFSKDFKAVETVTHWDKSENLIDSIMFENEIYEVIL